MSDREETQVYEQVIAEAARVLELAPPLVVHPSLAVATDSSGRPDLNLNEFEYEPSAVIEAVTRRTDGVTLCQPDAQGACRMDHLILSQVTRAGRRDAIVVVRARQSRTTRHVVVVLRHARGSWRITQASIVVARLS
jgi:hypothetical protein